MSFIAAFIVYVLLTAPLMLQFESSTWKRTCVHPGPNLTKCFVDREFFPTQVRQVPGVSSDHSFLNPAVWTNPDGCELLVCCSLRVLSSFFSHDYSDPRSGSRKLFGGHRRLRRLRRDLFVPRRLEACGTILVSDQEVTIF